MPKRKHCLAIAMAVCCIVVAARDASGLRDTDRVIKASNSFQRNTFSYIQKSTVVPSGVTVVTVEYDFFIDSELGGDFFRCDYYHWLNGWTNLYSISGHKSLRNSHTVTYTSAQPFYLRFSYSKNSSGDSDLDMVWVDNVVVKSNKGRLATYRFLGEPLVGTIPSGWVAGGSGGGWKLRRPPVERSVGPPENQVANTSTRMQKWISFPTSIDNKCTFDYFVDTASDHELKVYEANTLRFSSSGANQGTSEVFDIDDFPGPRWISIRYDLNAAPPEGLNLVRLDDLTCYSDGKIVGRFDFDGQNPETTPIDWSASCVPGGGSCAGVSGWQIRRATPHRSYVAPQAPPTAPVVDGMPDYHDETQLLVPNWALSGGKERDLYLSAFDNGIDPPALYLFVRLKSFSDGTQGDELGSFIVTYDDERDLTLTRTGECVEWDEPGNADRRLYFAYALPPGTESQTFGEPTIQLKGACTGGWTALDGKDTGPLTATAKIVDPGKKTLGLEIKIELSSITKAQGRVGIGFLRVTDGKLYEHFPYLQDSQGYPHESDTYTYETVELSALPTSGPKLTEDFDNCCYPKSTRRN